VTNQNGGGDAAIDALATHGGGDVSGWDTAGSAGYTAAHSSLTMDPMVVHPDAVQSAA
jgi:hypothetical protein